MEPFLGSSISNPLDPGAIYKQLKSVDEAITRLERQIHRNTRKLPTSSKEKAQGSEHPRTQELDVIRRLKKTQSTLVVRRRTVQLYLSDAHESHLLYILRFSGIICSRLLP